jgi:ABC-type transport system substrate-binding protein
MTAPTHASPRRHGSRAAFARGIACTVAACGVALWLLGWLFRPAPAAVPAGASAADLQVVRRMHALTLDREHPPSYHVPVDYAAGPAAPWYPRGEAPVLAALVAEGRLPPVAERVGPTPAVMRGAESLGVYGGTWLRLAATQSAAVGTLERISGNTLLRWSPNGYPLVPNLAEAVTWNADMSSYEITLRGGVRWSDGEPFTTDDVLYWWVHEANDPAVSSTPPSYMMPFGKLATLERIDARRFRVTFPHPYADFLEVLPIFRGRALVESPRHYLHRFHPRWVPDELTGDARAAYLARKMDFLRGEAAAYGLPSPDRDSGRALYAHIRQTMNPELPRLTPWIPREYRTTPPFVFVRNPYYWAVDEAGNQLPYVDRVQVDIQAAQMIGLSLGSGFVSMQADQVRYANFTELMTRRKAAGIRVLAWYSATRSVWTINPNQNRYVPGSAPGQRATSRADCRTRAARQMWTKSELLARKEFRQALSLALDRDAIIKAEYNGMLRPSQLAPGPESPFHHAGLAGAFLAYDPAGANARLDALAAEGLLGAARDVDGMRMTPEGEPLCFFIDFTSAVGLGPSQFVIDDWAAVGIRVIARERSPALFGTEGIMGDFDFHVCGGYDDFMPTLSPVSYVPERAFTPWAANWGMWFKYGGLWGDERAANNGAALAPPPGHPIRDAMQALLDAQQAASPDARHANWTRILDIAAENLWQISICEAPPQLVVVQEGFRNVPEQAVHGAYFLSPANTAPETYFFREPRDSAGTLADTRAQLERAGALPRRAASEPTADATTSAAASAASATAGALTGRLLRALFGLVALAFGVMLVCRHPFLLRRLVVMVPTLLVISVVVFTIIQLPPGDFLTTFIQQRELEGLPDHMEEVAQLKELFHYDDPVWHRYLRWSGMLWFTTFDREDTGLLQGNLGRSMETRRLVNDMVGDRILLTFLISLGTILFTWMVAIPIGVHSAVRQYSPSDYAFTLLGFIGMSVPSFLLALVLMVLANVSGLFSEAFAAQVGWTWPKVVDLLKHIWIPIAVMGVQGTAA